MGRQPVMQTGLKTLKEHGFEVPERLRETLALVALPQMQLLPWLTYQKKSL